MQEDDLYTDDEELDPAPSKSQRKRDAHGLQQLGTELLTVTESEWRKLALPEQLIDALKDAKRMPSHGARKRQLQYIGKLMRGIDAAPIQQYFEQLRLDARQQARQHHELEAWRDRMLAEGDAAIDSYIESHPAADRQHLRLLVRQANREQAGNQPPKSSRVLFRYIRECG
jgi:ribosome-associated protein